MTTGRRLRRFGPLAIGSALAGGAVLVGGSLLWLGTADTPPPLREWTGPDGEDVAALGREVLARRAQPNPAPVIAAPPEPGEAPVPAASPSRRVKAGLAHSASDLALARGQAGILGAALAKEADLRAAAAPLLAGDAPALARPDEADLPSPASAMAALPVAAEPPLAAPAQAAPPNAALTREPAMQPLSAAELAVIGASPAQAGELAVPAPSAPLAQPLAQARPLVVTPLPPPPAPASQPAQAPIPAASEAVTALAALPAQLPDASAAAPPAPRAASSAPAMAPTLAATRTPPRGLAPGQPVFPAAEGAPLFSAQDELILQLRVAGVQASDTIIAYGTRAGLYLPLGELAQILDLAIRVSDGGQFAGGWFLAEDRVIEIDLRQGTLTTAAGTVRLPPGMAQAFEGDLYLRSDFLASLLPIDIAPDLRAQAVLLTTREPFPFEERMRREALRAQLGQRGGNGTHADTFPREETPWRALSVPMASMELRGVSDSGKGTRAEGDLWLAGDVAFMTGQVFLGATTRDGLVAALVELGRRDADGDLLGPLGATEFQLGDVATPSLPLGLRGTAGRGGFVTNLPLEQASVFDRIDLRGVLPDGFEVELYRNDILLGSTARAVNGQYEFLEIPVDYGLNIFRLVFYGPQGQRREEVRRISVGDGRLSAGQLTYSFGMVQRGTNLLGVEGPDFRPGLRYGDWQATGELAYGLNSDFTAVASAAWYQDGLDQRWLASTGLRSGIGALAIRGDAGLSGGAASGMAHALGMGMGGPLLGGSFALTHFEYGGGFVDEVHSLDTAAMRRASEVDFNTALQLGSAETGVLLPLSARLRRAEYADGRTRLAAGVRGSARLNGLLLSSTLDYLRNAAPGGIGFSQLVGNFDLASIGRGDTQLRGSLGYRLLPDAALVQVGGNLAHRLDPRTLLSATAAYAIEAKDLALGLSAARSFDRFSLSLDGQYAFRQRSYAVALRLGLSFGRDPLRREFFVDRPGLATSGGVAVQAFHDRDGDGVFSHGDMALPGVDFAVFNAAATTDANGTARLTDLGHGQRVSVQIDPATLPDIAMAPARRGIEIVPRAGRIHVAAFPVVELSEVEGTVSFVGGEGNRGVSGLRLHLRDPAGEVAHTARTERGGYYFFEQVRPGPYALMIDPAQAERLGICLASPQMLQVPVQGTVIARDLVVTTCAENPAQVAASFTASE
ncbi:carboxypeptidase-like regulatory domain-containing protein [Alteraurantiacibacter palmitatis]|uniref:Carboxypeptidase-like regulatory domain-containing protein n=1 Tax=Alteraurantiacibacter palmitatis TaxID=2054628 RepID=A0ABV7E899_9SPHN